MPTPEEKGQEKEPLSPEDEEAVRRMLNADGSMTKPLALAYVQDLMVQFLDREIAGLEAMAKEGATELDRGDAALCAQVAKEAQAALKFSNTVLLAQQQAVQVAPATAIGKVKPIKVPGTRLPRGRR